MEKLLKLIGRIIDTAPSDEIKAQARAVLADCGLVRRPSFFVFNVLSLACRYMEALDSGAKWDEVELLADALEPWLTFDPRYIKQEPTKLIQGNYNNPDFFPLFEEKEEDGPELLSEPEEIKEEPETANLDGLEQLGYY